MAQHVSGKHHRHTMPGDPDDRSFQFHATFEMILALYLIRRSSTCDLRQHIKTVAEKAVAKRGHFRLEIMRGNWSRRRSVVNYAVPCAHHREAQVTAVKEEPDVKEGQLQDNQGYEEVDDIEKVCPPSREEPQD